MKKSSSLCLILFIFTICGLTTTRATEISVTTRNACDIDNILAIAGYPSGDFYINEKIQRNAVVSFNPFLIKEGENKLFVVTPRTECIIDFTSDKRDVFLNVVKAPVVIDGLTICGISTCEISRR